MTKYEYHYVLECSDKEFFCPFSLQYLQLLFLQFKTAYSNGLLS